MALHGDPQHLLGEMYFPGFIAELRKYQPGIHLLEPPLEDAERVLTENEAQLKLRLPQAYRNFVRFANGARLFALPDGVAVFGVYDTRLRGTPPHEQFVVDWNLQYRQSWPLPRPAELVTIGLLEDGTEVLMDLSRSNGLEAPVFLPRREHRARAKRSAVHPEPVVPEVSWPSLQEWLLAEMQRGFQRFGYQVRPLSARGFRRPRGGGGGGGMRGRGRFG